MTWRVPVSTQEPVYVSTDKPAAAADIRILHWAGAIGPVGGIRVRELIGTGKVMKIKAIHAEIDNTAGVASQTYVQFAQVIGVNATIFCDLICPVPANDVIFIDFYDGADTVHVDTDVWTYALPNIILTGDFSILFFPNVNVDGDYTMLYEVYEA